MKRFSIVLSVVFCLFLFAGVVRTIEAKVVASPPVKVNVLDGVDANDDRVGGIVKEANKSLKQADVSLDLDPNISRGVSDEGNDDGKIQGGEDPNLDEKGQDEINGEFGNGVGLKVYFTNQIHDDNDITGCAPHVKDVNGSLEGKPIIYIKNDPARTNEQLGRTLAHEACHVFTLGDKGLIDINDSLKFVFSDGNGHVNFDSNNLMCQSSLGDGNELTPIQRREIFVGAARHCNKVKNVVRLNDRTAPTVTTWPLMRGGWVDDMYEVPLEYVDLGAGFFFAEHPLSNLEISILTEGLFPPMPINMLFSIYINSDGNPATGDPGPIPGVDRIIEINVQGEHPGGEVTAHLQDTISGTTTFLPFASTQRIKKIIDHNTTPYSEPYVDGVYLQVPMELLGEVNDMMDGMVVSLDFGSALSDDVMFIWEDTSDTDPAMELITTQIEPGDPIVVSGQNYAPGSVISVFVDDELIGTTSADGGGSFSNVSFFFGPGSDPFEGGVCSAPWYFVRARDTEGGSDYSILELKPYAGDINMDTVVDFKDFGAMCNNWLAGVE